MARNRKQKKKDKQKAAEQRRQREFERQQQAIARQLEEARKNPRPKVEEKPAFPEPKQVIDQAKALSKNQGSDTDDELWDSFESADLEGKIRLFDQFLDEGKLDDEYAFEILNEIHGQLDKNDRSARTRFAGMVDRLRQQAPDLYQHDIQYYNDMLIMDAISGGNWEAVPELLSAYTNPKYADTLDRIQEMLLYHGQGKLLVPVFAKALPAFKESPEIFDWVAEEIGGELMLIILDGYLETAKNPQPDDPDLLTATAPYGRWKEGWLERFVPRLAAKAPSPWKLEDFGPLVDADQWMENLHDLLAEFVADCRQAGTPSSRGRMAWEVLSKTLEDQFSAGAFPDKKERREGKERKGNKPRSNEQKSVSPLLPDYGSLDRALSEYFHILGSHPYKVAAGVELLPAYLHFLARLGLIHPTEMDNALQQFTKLGEQAIPILENYGADPESVNAVREAWSPQAIERLRSDPALAEARSRPVETLPIPTTKESSPTAGLSVYTFKVSYLQDADIWRSIEIVGNQTLDDLHDAIQDAVSFDNDHLYSFFMSNRAWDKTSEYASPRAGKGHSASRVKIGDLNLRMKQRFLYLFDYGDEHRFEVQLTGVNPNPPKGKYPRLVESHGEDPSQYGSMEEDEEWDTDDEDWDEDGDWEDEDETGEE